MYLSKENLRNKTGVLYEEFGATLVKNAITGKELWWIQDEEVNTTGDSREIEYFGTFAEDKGLRLFPYKDLNRPLWVEPGDTIIVNFRYRKNGECEFEVENLGKECYASITQNLGPGIIDKQDRRDVLLSLAHTFKDIPCVKFQYYLTYTDEQFLTYIENSDVYYRL